jgi:hypothetical protein
MMPMGSNWTLFGAILDSWGSRSCTAMAPYCEALMLLGANFFSDTLGTPYYSCSKPVLEARDKTFPNYLPDASQRQEILKCADMYATYVCVCVHVSHVICVYVYHIYIYIYIYVCARTWLGFYRP